MKKNEFTFQSADGINQIHVIEWIPEGKPRAILQIAHGMIEYIDRYDRFASFLAERGFYVVGNDHLGHGLTAGSSADLGFFHESRGNEFVIRDLDQLRKITEEKYPDVPYFAMGHSMGSFLMRQYIEMHGKGLSGAIIMGTGSQPESVLKLGKRLCSLIGAVRGKRYRSKMVDFMAFASNNNGIKNPRTTHDWLTKDTEVVDRYLKNPLNTFRFTVQAYYDMFSGIEYCQQKEHIEQIPKNLPILVVSGAEDPVGANTVGVKQAYEALKAAGLPAQLKLYPGDRHEILNELDYETVQADLLQWLETALENKNAESRV
ncbi:MAG: lysophospholipase [Lachnospiraceae bacterium]|nr:lysophospholipase [Lachnospiraceae bacterium]